MRWVTAAAFLGSICLALWGCGGGLSEEEVQDLVRQEVASALFDLKQGPAGPQGDPGPIGPVGTSRLSPDDRSNLFDVESRLEDIENQLEEAYVQAIPVRSSIGNLVRYIVPFTRLDLNGLQDCISDLETALDALIAWEHDHDLVSKGVFTSTTGTSTESPFDVVKRALDPLNRRASLGMTPFADCAFLVE